MLRLGGHDRRSGPSTGRDTCFVNIVRRHWPPCLTSGSQAGSISHQGNSLRDPDEPNGARGEPLVRDTIGISAPFRLDRTKRRLVRAVPIVSEGSSTKRCSVLAVETDAIQRNGQGNGPIRTAGLIVHLAGSAFERYVDRCEIWCSAKVTVTNAALAPLLLQRLAAPEVESVRLSVLFSDFSSRRRRKHCKNQSNAATGGPTTWRHFQPQHVQTRDVPTVRGQAVSAADTL